MLYAASGQTMVKLEDGSWEIIDVEERFSQGCPLLPVFAEIMLNHILSKLEKLMLQRACNHHRQCFRIGLSPDDDQGGIPIVMGYMDDINAVARLRNEAPFLKTMSLRQFGL